MIKCGSSMYGLVVILGGGEQRAVDGGKTAQVTERETDGDYSPQKQPGPWRFGSDTVNMQN